MSKSDIENYIRERKQNTRSIGEQIIISHAKLERGIGPQHDGLKASEVEDELNLDLDYSVRTSLKHLEDINIVEEFLPPGPETLAIAEWMDNGDGEVVNGDVEEAAWEGIDGLIDDFEALPDEGESATAADGSGTTVHVVSDEFDLVPNKAEEFFRTTTDPVEDLNKAVQAIKEAESVDTGDDYGEIVFINMPYRYRLTEKAINLYDGDDT